MHQTRRLCGQRVREVYRDWQMFLPTENCTLRAMFLRQTACHRGWSPLPSPLLPNLVPNPQPRVQPNLLPRWQPGLQPSLQLESPFPWPQLSVCTSSESNTLARKSGTQSQFLSRTEHASQRTAPGSFVVHIPSHLHVLFCVARFVLCPLHSNWACEETVTWGMFPQGCEDTVARSRLLCKGGTRFVKAYSMVPWFEEGGAFPCPHGNACQSLAFGAIQKQAGLILLLAHFAQERSVLLVGLVEGRLNSARALRKVGPDMAAGL